MGSPLAPVLANIFMGFYKSKWLNEHNLNKPKFYLRYVDDILATFDNEQDSLDFLNFLNNMHSNIKFTIEKQIKQIKQINKLTESSVENISVEFLIPWRSAILTEVGEKIKT